ncbi:amine sulfotransferase-like [Rhinophrynus dorsalis]
MAGKGKKKRRMGRGAGEEDAEKGRGGSEDGADERLWDPRYTYEENRSILERESIMYPRERVRDLFARKEDVWSQVLSRVNAVSSCNWIIKSIRKQWSDYNRFLKTMSEEAVSVSADPKLFKHKGSYFVTELTTPEIIDSLEHFEIRDSDVYLVTYPKSGTVWTQQILSLIFNEGHRNGTEQIENVDRVPWLEYNLKNMDYVSRPSPRLFCSHLPYYLMPKELRNRKAKIIYVSRNPKDAFVSLYHFHKIMISMTETDDLQHLLHQYITGQVLCGSWFDHIIGWYTHKEDFNILFMTFEEMKMDLRSAVLKICKFVGKELDDEAVDTVVEKATFKIMKQDPLANYNFLSGITLKKDKGAFLRKGATGDWKNIMTVAQNELFDKVYKEKMKDMPIKFIWDTDEEN